MIRLFSKPETDLRFDLNIIGLFFKTGIGLDIVISHLSLIIFKKSFFINYFILYFNIDNN